METWTSLDLLLFLYIGSLDADAESFPAQHSSNSCHGDDFYDSFVISSTNSISLRLSSDLKSTCKKKSVSTITLTMVSPLLFSVVCYVSWSRHIGFHWDSPLLAMRKETISFLVSYFLRTSVYSQIWVKRGIRELYSVGGQTNFIPGLAVTVTVPIALSHLALLALCTNCNNNPITFFFYLILSPSLLTNRFFFSVGCCSHCSLPPKGRIT